MGDSFYYTCINIGKNMRGNLPPHHIINMDPPVYL